MLPRIMGKMPYNPLSGRHWVPSRNFSGPIFPMAGRPLANKNTQISTTAKMDTLAFSEYCEMLRSYALDFLNIEIPDPDPEWKNEKINK